MLYTSQEELEEMRRRGDPAVESPAQPAAQSPAQPAMSLLDPVMPQTPWQRASDNYGSGEAAMRRIGNLLTGGLFADALIPEFSDAGHGRYKAETDLYAGNLKSQQDLRNALREQEALAYAEGNRVAGLGQEVIKARATADPDDDLAAYNKYLAGGGTSEGLTRIAGKMPEYQVIDNNGTPTLFDKNNPESRGIPMMASDGTAMHKAPDQWMIKQAGAFDRMAPRLQELDEMERAGTTIDRSKMSELRAMEAADAAGDRVMATRMWQEWMDVTLTPEERGYVLAAEDAGMIVLRDESGAAISASEILRQMNQYMMFSDYDRPTMVRQRKSRNRKAQTLIRDLPDYVRANRADWIDWVDNFDGSMGDEVAGAEAMTAGNEALPSMTQEQMTRYLALIEADPDKAARLVELIRLTQEQ